MDAIERVVVDLLFKKAPSNMRSVARYPNMDPTLNPDHAERLAGLISSRLQSDLVIEQIGVIRADLHWDNARVYDMNEWAAGMAQEDEAEGPLTPVYRMRL